MSSQNQYPQQQHLQLENCRPDGDYYPQQQMERHESRELIEHDPYDENNPQFHEDDSSEANYARQVKFSTDCKQDVSHLTPQRKKGES